MSYSIGDELAEGSSSCCDDAVIDPSGENIEGICRGCGEHCGIVTAASYRQECIDTNEHMKHIYSEGGYDKCYNCGGLL